MNRVKINITTEDGEVLDILVVEATLESTSPQGLARIVADLINRDLNVVEE